VEKLERHLGLTGVVAISISAMLGSGIFVLPGLAAGLTGPSVFVAYILAGICVLPAALSKSELATAMPTSGGTYVYLDRAFGPLVGTIAGLGLWFSLLLKSAFALLGFGAYLVVFADVQLKPVALAMLGLVVLLNMRGVKSIGKLQLVIVSISLAGLGGLSTVGVMKFEPARLTPFLTDGVAGLFGAVAFVFVSFAGVTKVAAIAEEVKKPERNLPAGILVSLALVTVLYGATALMLVGVLPMETLGNELAPIHALAQALGGKWLGIPAGVLGVLTMTSMANAGLLAASRFPFAMSRDELLPPFLSKLHPKFLTPNACILLSGGIMAGVIVGIDVAGIAKLASIVMIALFGAVNLSVLVLRESGVAWYQPAYRSPFYPWTQVFGIASAVALLAAAGPKVAPAAIAVSAPGALLWFIYGRKKTHRLGVLGLRGRRKDLLSDIRPAQTMPEVELTGEARGVVALFGKERSPEILVELAAALTERGKIEVIYVTEVPEQTIVDAVEAENPRIVSIGRRVLAMAEREKLDVDFKSIYSHDVIHTVHEVTDRLHCEWLVMQWEGRRADALTIRNPLGWLKDHVNCNLAIFSDAGIRYITKVLAIPQPGSHDTLVTSVADHLTELNRGEMTLATWLPGDAPQDVRLDTMSYLEQMRALTSDKADIELLPGKSAPHAVRDASAGYDLIVTVEPPVGSIVDRLRGRHHDKLTESATCSVLRVQSPHAETHVRLDWKRSAYKEDEVGMVLGFLRPELAGARLERKRKEALFEHFAKTFADAIPDLEAAQILAALREREREQNTAVGHGVALPHATLPIQGTVLGVFTTKDPIDYKAPDGSAVDVFFLTLGPQSDRQTHLIVLSALAKLLLKTDLGQRLREAKDADALVEAMHEAAHKLDGGQTIVPLAPSLPREDDALPEAELPPPTVGEEDETGKAPPG
jgi:amino acid transporter/mannitol/fructose-specific phosphotransferase system IIA component (Ntr-type)